MEDSDLGMAWPLTVIDPDGVSVDMEGLSQDISELIDPNTGAAISGRLASVALRVATLAYEGLVIPEGVMDESVRPWIVRFDSINGVRAAFKVVRTKPDRTIGLVVCMLEHYDEGT
jgi:hypothetical protein